MAENLSHDDWVREQFKKKYLKGCYRNVFIHSSIIEGILTNESGMDKFDSANKFLLCSQKIISSEFCVFNEIRKIRNRLAHNIFEGKGLPGKDINKLLSNLMNQIYKAYKISVFLNEKLFMKYKINRIDLIEFN